MTQFDTVYPALGRILTNTTFADDWEAAINASQTASRDVMMRLLQSGKLKSSFLTYVLGSPVLTDYNETQRDALNLEWDVARLTAALGSDRVAAAFRDKLLVDVQYEDVRHEIVVASILLDFFNPKSMELEAAIPGTSKNSDVAGMRLTQVYRVEATVIHEDWPPSPPSAVQDQLESINLPMGYSVGLREPVLHPVEADVVVAAIREIYDQRCNISTLGCALSFGTAWPGEDANSFVIDKGPIDEIAFHDKPDIRVVGQPAYSRATMDKSEWEQIQNPKGVITSADVALQDRTHNSRPLGTKIWQALDRKRSQCPSGALNIIAMKILRPLEVSSLEDALFGVTFTSFERGPRGGLGAAKLFRKGSGPFTPVQFSENSAEFVDPFRVISGVWMISQAFGYPKSKLFRNPNASIPIPEEAASLLESIGLQRCRR